MKAIDQYTLAVDLAETNEDAYDVIMGQAKCASKLGRKSQARSYARNALVKKSGAKDAYNLIGNLYFSSSTECNQGKSRVIDRGSFIAAYEMYKKAGNSAQMSASIDQFPSIGEIFEEGYEEGDMITVGCWINETVKLQRRPATN